MEDDKILELIGTDSSVLAYVIEQWKHNINKVSQLANAKNVTTNEAEALQPKYVILVALDFEHFEHYCMNPKIYYDSIEEAEEQLTLKLKQKDFEEVQLKIQKLWLMPKSKIK